jgi:putative GTP pyrophosphokinase
MVEQPVAEGIIAEYESNAHVYRLLVSKLEQLLPEILSARGIVTHSINGRTKSRESLIGKLSKDDSTYEALKDVTDLAGLRIITYFSKDVDRVAEAIAEEFAIDNTNSIDKRQSLGTDRFGYLSLHHVLSLKDSRCDLIEYKVFRGLKVEIQTRSILQHAWAEIEHDLGYKSAIEVPQHIRRRFARVASLLELADDEFEGIKQELHSYRAEVPAAIQENPRDVSLNLDSLRVFIKNSAVSKSIDHRLVELVKGRLEDSIAVSNKYLTRLQFLGIKTIGELSEVLMDNEDFIILYAKNWIKTTAPSLPAGVSMYYLWLVLLSDKNADDIAYAIEKGGFTEDVPIMVGKIIAVGRQTRIELFGKDSDE